MVHLPSDETFLALMRKCHTKRAWLWWAIIICGIIWASIAIEQLGHDIQLRSDELLYSYLKYPREAQECLMGTLWEQSIDSQHVIGYSQHMCKISVHDQLWLYSLNGPRHHLAFLTIEQTSQCQESIHASLWIWVITI